MAKGLARTFGQDLMRGEHEVGTTTNGGVLMPSHTSGDPGFYAKKRAREAEIGRELTTEEFLAEHYEASDAPTASGTSIFDPVLCEIAYRWFCPQGGTVLDPFAGGSVRGIVASRLGRRYVGIELRPEQVEANRAQVAIAAEPLPIHADPARITQVVAHLLLNAAKYSPAADRIELIVSRDNHHAHLAVRDHGIGIHPTDLDRIFERFYRATNGTAANPDGLGLGLFIAREIVTRSGGTLRAASTPAAGTTFHLTLPLADDIA